MSAAVGTQKDGSSVMGSIAVEMVVLPFWPAHQAHNKCENSQAPNL